MKFLANGKKNVNAKGNVHASENQMLMEREYGLEWEYEFKSNYRAVIRERKQRRRRRQRERQKSKTTTLHVYHPFLYISLPSLHDYNIKVRNFTFCRGREHTTTTFFFFSWTVIQSFRIQLQNNLPEFDELNEMG